MKILHLSIGKFGNPVPARAGGAVEQTIEVLASSHTEKGHEVEVIVLVSNAHKKLLQNSSDSKVDFVYFYFDPKKKFSFYLGVIQCLREIMKRNHDIINIHVPHFAPIVKLLTIGKTGKIIWHVHNKSKFSSLARISNINYVGVSQSVLKQNKTDGSKNSKVIHNMVRNDVFPFIDSETRVIERRKLEEEDKFVIGFVGRISSEKGLDILIEAIRKIPVEVRSSVKLLIAGSSGFKNSPESSYQTQTLLNLAGIDVNILGYVDNWELYKFYARCDVIVVPSIWEEPAGQVVIESQACGTKVIGSNIGGIPEYLSPYELTFEAGNSDALRNSIVDCIDSKDSENMSLRSTWVRESFNINRISDDWIVYYTELVGE